MGSRFFEGPAGEPFLLSAEDASRLLEACFAEGADSAILYASNLPAHFFDLSSGVAGVLLQKLRIYRIRLAVVFPPETHFSRMFGEMAREESHTGYFGLFESRQAAEAWLAKS